MLVVALSGAVSPNSFGHAHLRDAGVGPAHGHPGHESVASLVGMARASGEVDADAISTRDIVVVHDSLTGAIATENSGTGEARAAAEQVAKGAAYLRSIGATIPHAVPGDPLRVRINEPVFSPYADMLNKTMTFGATTPDALKALTPKIEQSLRDEGANEEAVRATMDMLLKTPPVLHKDPDTVVHEMAHLSVAEAVPPDTDMGGDILHNIMKMPKMIEDVSIREGLSDVFGYTNTGNRVIGVEPLSRDLGVTPTEHPPHGFLDHLRLAAGAATGSVDPHALGHNVGHGAYEMRDLGTDKIARLYQGAVDDMHARGDKLAFDSLSAAIQRTAAQQFQGDEHAMSIVRAGLKAGRML